MFGHVQADLDSLDDEEKARYRAVYCGLCRTLGKRHGVRAKLVLSYDFVFLVLLLSSLYEPEEERGRCRCCARPCKKHDYVSIPYMDYAADMTVALAYHKCMDDWMDDRKLSRRCYAALLRKPYEKVKTQWPEQCDAMEQCLAQLSEIERTQPDDPDAVANCFGALMETVFLYRRDYWELYLRALGCGLGRYIYLADAAVDLERDRARGDYNPLRHMCTQPQEMRPVLTTVLGVASEAFESLPLEQDAHLMRNILYSGIWIKYEQSMQKSKKERGEKK